MMEQSFATTEAPMRNAGRLRLTIIALISSVAVAMTWTSAHAGARNDVVDLGEAPAGTIDKFEIEAHSGLRPGRYAGRLDIVCETCGDLVLGGCAIDLRSLTIEVEVVARQKRRRPGTEGPVQVRTDASPR